MLKFECENPDANSSCNQFDSDCNLQASIS